MTVAFAGVSVIEVKVGTVNVVVVERVPAAAVMVDVPIETALAIPDEPTELLIVATAGLEELQTTEERICVLPSEYVPVAINCCVNPTKTEGAVGAMAIDTRPGGVSDVGWYDSMLASVAPALIPPIKATLPLDKRVPVCPARAVARIWP